MISPSTCNVVVQTLRVNDEFVVNPDNIRAQYVMLGLQSDNARNQRKSAKDIRNEFMRYFNEEGAVPWQKEVCHLKQICLFCSLDY